MKTTKRYKLLLLLPFFLSLPSLASDSLKVKKTDYYEDGKLVRSLFYDVDSLKYKDILNHYTENFEDIDTAQNKITQYIIKKNKVVTEISYHAKIIGDSIVFYNPDSRGYTSNFIYDSLGRLKTSIDKQILFKTSITNPTMLIDSVAKNIVESKYPFKKYFSYDNKGNMIEYWWKNPEGVNLTKFGYDSLNRLNSITRFEFGISKKTIYAYTEHTKYLSKVITSYENEKLIEYTIKDTYKDEKNRELKIMDYKIRVKRFKPIGEPKLTFTQENIYENDRIVKIIYEDLLLGKKKVHELKYEFY